MLPSVAPEPLPPLDMNDELQRGLKRLRKVIAELDDAMHDGHKIRSTVERLRQEADIVSRLFASTHRTSS